GASAAIHVPGAAFFLASALLVASLAVSLAIHPRNVTAALLVICLLLAPAASAQKQNSMPGMDMSSDQMDMPGMRLMQQMHPHSFVDEIQSHTTSGTSAEPNSTPAPMLLSMHGQWMWMLHGVAFVADTQQSGPRGRDKFFS